MAGSISLSLSQQFDSLGKPLSGGLLYTYAAGTTTPQSAYSDTGLVTALANPIVLDSAGRVPQLFFADGNIKVRLTDRVGNVQLTADNILVIGPSASGGGGATVDATALIQTGWIQPIYGTGNITGFVRLNGRTLGNASSGATERANADTAALFAFLYSADTNLTVSGGRGASSTADYAANKTIILPDFRGRTIAGLDDMGNSAAGRLTATYFGAAATTLGLAGGGETGTLLLTNLPPITPAGTVTGVSVTSSISNIITGSIQGGNGANTNFSTGGGSLFPALASSSAASQAITSTGSGTFTGTLGGGSSTPFRTTQPTMLATIYIKL